MSDVIQLTKLDAARRQLQTAISLYFSSADEVSAHALAAAALNALTDLARHARKQSTLSLDTLLGDYVQPQHHKSVRDKVRAPENFFKHADRDPDAQITFNPRVTECWLLQAVDTYQVLDNTKNPVFQAFKAWWLIQHRQLLTPRAQQLISSLTELQYGASERANFYTDFMAMVQGSAQYAVGN